MMVSSLNPMTLLPRRSLNRLMKKPEGRAFLLQSMAEAEEADERGVFDALLARVDDEKLQQLVRIHVADEERHAGLLRGVVARIDAAPPPVPHELQYVQRLNAKLDDIGARFAGGALGVMEAYAFLEFIEARAVREWPAIVAELRRYDTGSADVVASIVADEARHVKYARAIARRYAPDDATLAATRARIKAAEARAFAEHGSAFLRFIVGNDLMDVGGAERAMWRVLSRASAPVPFAATTPAMQHAA